MSVLRCQSCRILVDVSPSSTMCCAACGGPLEHGAPPATIWDDDDPTVRRPISYASDLPRHAR
ncbi:MAG TPA: hypothetical protein VGL86_33060 [Polyangia bacterium]